MRQSADVPLLLDTHVWIWLLDGTPGKLSTACLALLRRASRENRIWISPISVREVATLESKKRVTLSMDCRSWVEAGLRAPGVRLAEFSPAVAIASVHLPGQLHGDPADRILVATARQRKETLVTEDAAILSYAALGYVSALDAGA